METTDKRTHAKSVATRRILSTVPSVPNGVGPLLLPRVRTSGDVASQMFPLVLFRLS